MTEPRTTFIVTGLPASGKSTVGKRIAERLRCDFLDKDDFLEALFEERGIGDSDWRRELSRKSDLFFEQAARSCDMVVLVSHWRPRGNTDTSGTPTEWLSDGFERIIELFCDCPADIATERFIRRKRHRGHCDESRNRNELLNWMDAYARELPLGAGSGPAIRIETAYDINIDGAMDELASLISTR